MEVLIFINISASDVVFSFFVSVFNSGLDCSVPISRTVIPVEVLKGESLTLFLVCPLERKKAFRQYVVLDS